MKSFTHHLTTEIKKNALQYLLLFTAAIFFVLLVSLFKGDRYAQYIILTTYIVFYIVWGAIHHFMEKTLRFEVVLEYILIGAVVLFLLQNLLLR